MHRIHILVVFLIICCVDHLDAEISISKTTCPGLYCGKVATNDTCGACPRGYRPDNFSQCQRCNDSVTFYDALYLGFMALISLALHWYFIDSTCRSRSKWKEMILHLSAFFESFVAALFTLLLSDPVGSLQIRSCRVQQLSDWYTMLYNPSPNYADTLYCTQEVVYPLYTIVMIYYAISLVLMMLVRPFLCYKLVDGRGYKSIYAALYFLPVLIVSQAVFSGLIYYAFPYMILAVSVVANAVHFASIELDEDDEDSMVKLVKLCATKPRHAIILFGHWLLHAYGIIALTRLETPWFHASLLALIPSPAIFYILTVSFTNPDKLNRVS